LWGQCGFLLASIPEHPMACHALTAVLKAEGRQPLIDCGDLFAGKFAEHAPDPPLIAIARGR
jgi:hypothetical protein